MAEGASGLFGAPEIRRPDVSGYGGSSARRARRPAVGCARGPTHRVPSGNAATGARQPGRAFGGEGAPGDQLFDFCMPAGAGGRLLCYARTGYLRKRWRLSGDGLPLLPSGPSCSCKSRITRLDRAVSLPRVTARRRRLPFHLLGPPDGTPPCRPSPSTRLALASGAPPCADPPARPGGVGCTRVRGGPPVPRRAVTRLQGGPYEH